MRTSAGTPRAPRRRSCARQWQPPSSLVLQPGERKEYALRLALADGPLDRDLIVLATSAEELGLLGAEAFVSDPSVPLPTIAALPYASAGPPSMATKGDSFTQAGTEWLSCMTWLVSWLT